MIPRLSLLDPDVQVFPHPAPDNLIAHVEVVMTRFMYYCQVFRLPVLVIPVNVMHLYFFITKQFVSTSSARMVLSF